MEEKPVFSCRGCLADVQTGNFHPFACDETKNLFTDCTSIPIQSDELDLPQQICSECYIACQQWSDFRNRCLEVNEQLLSSHPEQVWVQEESVIEEVLEDEDIIYYEESPEVPPEPHSMGKLIRVEDPIRVEKRSVSTPGQPSVQRILNPVEMQRKKERQEARIYKEQCRLKQIWKKNQEINRNRKLIAQIADHPELYTKEEGGGYMKRSVKDCLWNSILRQVPGFTMTQAIDRWRYLRRRYIDRKTTGARSNSYWEYDECMRFLDKVSLHHRDTISNDNSTDQDISDLHTPEPINAKRKRPGGEEQLDKVSQHRDFVSNDNSTHKDHPSSSINDLGKRPVGVEKLDKLPQTRVLVSNNNKSITDKDNSSKSINGNEERPGVAQQVDIKDGQKKFIRLVQPEKNVPTVGEGLGIIVQGTAARFRGTHQLEFCSIVTTFLFETVSSVKFQGYLKSYKN